MSGWLTPGEMRVALGCMRAFTDAHDEARGAAVIRAALDLGITLFDTARAYGESERVLGEILREHDPKGRARVITKGGMTRRGDGTAWRPDGRARALRADCEASLAALGVPIDTYLVHAPDPEVPWATTVRALARLVSEKLVQRVGVCNVSRRQLDEAIDLAPIAAVQVALGANNDAALRGGVVARCAALGIDVLAHSPFGGPKRAGRLALDAALLAIGRRHDVDAHGALLALLLDLDPSIVPVAGTQRADHVATFARAARITLEDEDRALVRDRFPWRRVLHPPTPTFEDKEVVLLMGMQGAGKSTLVRDFEARGYERLNRDERGGTLRQLNALLDERLAAGATRLVLDNTYTTRESRYDVIATAHARGARVHGTWLDIDLDQAQVNVILRMLAAHGRLLEPEEMARLRDPTALPPLALQRIERALERPAADEGFDALEFVPFVRRPSTGTHTARFVAQDLMCPHAPGPPKCWCRPPLPGLLLAFAVRHDVDLTRSVVVGTSPTHEKMARSVGAGYESAT